MKNVLLLIHRRVLADSLNHLAREDTLLTFYTEQNPENALLSIECYQIDIAVVEVAESGASPAKESLALCDAIKEQHPNCKILLLCSEHSKSSKEEAVRAKQEKRIDDFIFYDTSVEYLMTKLESM